MNIKRILNAIEQISQNRMYLKCLKKPVNERAFLLEAGQGKHINGNIFAILKVLEMSEAFEMYTPYIVIEEKIRKNVEQKLACYAFKKAKILVRDGKEYKRVLATAKYLITDNTFPPYFVKRKEQIYLNTWHGTPLKQLGRSDIINSTSIGNIQKNFLVADYLLFPNSYTREIMMKDYMIDRLYTGKTITIDYPRNDALFQNNLKDEITAKYQLQNKRVIAYMPTWRGTGRSADINKQLNDADCILAELDKGLQDDEEVYVNFHFLIRDKIDYSKYKKIKRFPTEYETYDFLGVCDGLITDYSSVMFDFAQTGRDVIMFIYDYEEYKKGKGFYFDINELPFKIVYTAEELLGALHCAPHSYSLDEKYVGNNFGNAAAKVLDLICRAKTDGLKIEITKPKRDIKVIHVGNLNLKHHRYLTANLMESFTDEEKRKTVLTFENKIDGITAEFLKALDEDVEFIRVLPSKLKGLWDYLSVKCNVTFGWFAKRAEQYYLREYERAFSGIDGGEIQLLITNIIEYQYIVSVAQTALKTIHKLPAYFYGKENLLFRRHPQMRERVESRYNRVIDYTGNYGAELWEEELPCKGIVAELSRLKYKMEEHYLKINGTMRIISFDMPVETVGQIKIGPARYDFQKKNVKQFSRHSVHYLQCAIAIAIKTDEINFWNIHNEVQVLVKAYGTNFSVSFLSPRPRCRFKKLIYSLDQFQNVCYFREGLKYYKITIRERNITDSWGVRMMLFLAWACHMITFWYKPVVLYEKNASRYEESASVLLEKLIDCGYGNAKYILDRNYPNRDRISEKYRKYMVNRFSFEHYYCIFAAKSFISSETVAHALESRTTSRLFKWFIQNGAKNYVFLQHGVMYMVSLSAEQRNFFNKPKGKGTYKIVVSSKLEAEHFIEYSDYEAGDIYVSGLLKFDKSVMDEGADKITVMLTWRPWDYVRGLHGIQNTSYYKLLKKIVENVPEKMKNKLVVLPHPLIAEQLNSEQCGQDMVWKYYRKTVKYDDILKKTKLLITDYSSISYDAFYRGANVIFYWEEKEACMKKYGPNAKLMLSEELAFGDVCYSADDIKTCVEEAYENSQKAEYISRFRQIVTYHDGRNTDRLIKWIKEDGIL